MDSESALSRAKELAGGATGLARAIAKPSSPITPQAISQWKKVPADRVIDVERVTGVSRAELRPDLYPPIAPSDEPPTSEHTEANS